VDDIVYAAAGRSAYLDDGIAVVGLDCATGEKRHEARLVKKPQDPATDIGDGWHISGVAIDVMSYDGSTLYVGNIAMDKSLKKIKGSQTLRIQAVPGFLDDLGWNRNIWKCSDSYIKWGERKRHNQLVCGQIMVHDDKCVYGARHFLDRTGQSAIFYPGHKGSSLFASPLGVQSVKKKKKKSQSTETAGETEKKEDGTWETIIHVRVNAMIRAADKLFIAGPPDVLDEKDPMGIFEGRKGGILKTYSAADGKELSELKLDSPPVFDGLIAVDGKLFISHANGKVSCRQ
jgi:hypothetical protein